MVRNSRSQEIELQELLVGDVLCFGAGDILPADGLIFQASDVKCALLPPLCAWSCQHMLHGHCWCIWQQMPGSYKGARLPAWGTTSCS